MLMLEKEDVKDWRPHVPFPDQYQRAQATYVAQVVSGKRTLEEIQAEGADSGVVEFVTRKLKNVSLSPLLTSDRSAPMMTETSASANSEQTLTEETKENVESTEDQDKLRALVDEYIKKVSHYTKIILSCTHVSSNYY
eukprot:m.273285 g.273285  ORF g.273285 m.273285 type:complete len:138 (+) comp16278_c0_seq9:2-415(+)